MTRQKAPTQSTTHRLHQALRIDAKPDWPAARAAILAGAPVDTPIPSWSGKSPLALAIMLNGRDEVGWLLDHGADMEAMEPDGKTALTSAVEYGSMVIIDKLLAHGADPNTRDKDGWTVLMVVALLTATESAKDFIAALLDHGADPSATTPDGYTAPEIFMASSRPERTGYLDEALASDHHTAARRRLLDRLTADQRPAWLPKACAAEAAMAVRIAWRRAP